MKHSTIILILSLCIFLSATIAKATDVQTTVEFSVAAPTDVEVAIVDANDDFIYVSDMLNARLLQLKKSSPPPKP